MANKILDGCKIAVCGGDEREIVVMHSLAQLGAALINCGFEQVQEEVPGRFAPWPDILSQADVVVIALSGIDPQGKLYSPLGERQLVLTPQALDLLFQGQVFLTGRISSLWRQKLLERGIKLVVSTDDDELNILNAIPTAEGVIEEAMNLLPVTLHGSHCMILGYGRCARPLALMLKGLGAKVTIAARRREALAEAKTSGYETMLINRIRSISPDTRLIVNTIPSLVLTADVLCQVPNRAVILDIASYPGGVDFIAAEKLGIKAKLLPGIPGKRAPESAGNILAQVYPGLIIAALNERREEVK